MNSEINENPKDYSERVEELNLDNKNISVHNSNEEFCENSHNFSNSVKSEKKQNSKGNETKTHKGMRFSHRCEDCRRFELKNKIISCEICNIKKCFNCIEKDNVNYKFDENENFINAFTCRNCSGKNLDDIINEKPPNYVTYTAEDLFLKSTEKQKKFLTKKRKKNEEIFDMSFIERQSKIMLNEKSSEDHEINKLNNINSFDEKFLPMRKSERTKKPADYSVINCHQCKKIHFTTNIITCCNIQCRESFCSACTKKYFARGVSSSKFLKMKSSAENNTWICFKCKNLCSCKECRIGRISSQSSTTNQKCLTRKKNKLKIQKEQDYSSNKSKESLKRKNNINIILNLTENSQNNDDSQTNNGFYYDEKMNSSSIFNENQEDFVDSSQLKKKRRKIRYGTKKLSKEWKKTFRKILSIKKKDYFLFDDEEVDDYEEIVVARVNVGDYLVLECCNENNEKILIENKRKELQFYNSDDINRDENNYFEESENMQNFMNSQVDQEILKSKDDKLEETLKCHQLMEKEENGIINNVIFYNHLLKVADKVEKVRYDSGISNIENVNQNLLQSNISGNLKDDKSKFENNCAFCFKRFHQKNGLLTFDTFEIMLSYIQFGMIFRKRLFLIKIKEYTENLKQIFDFIDIYSEISTDLKDKKKENQKIFKEATVDENVNSINDEKEDFYNRLKNKFLEMHFDNKKCNYEFKEEKRICKFCFITVINMKNGLSYLLNKLSSKKKYSFMNSSSLFIPIYRDKKIIKIETKENNSIDSEEIYTQNEKTNIHHILNEYTPIKENKQPDEVEEKINNLAFIESNEKITKKYNNIIKINNLNNGSHSSQKDDIDNINLHFNSEDIAILSQNPKNRGMNDDKQLYSELSQNMVLKKSQTEKKPKEKKKKGPKKEEKEKEKEREDKDKDEKDKDKDEKDKDKDETDKDEKDKEEKDKEEKDKDKKEKDKIFTPHNIKTKAKIHSVKTENNLDTLQQGRKKHITINHKKISDISFNKKNCEINNDNLNNEYNMKIDSINIENQTINLKKIAEKTNKKILDSLSSPKKHIISEENLKNIPHLIQPEPNQNIPSQIISNDNFNKPTKTEEGKDFQNMEPISANIQSIQNINQISKVKPSSNTTLIKNTNSNIESKGELTLEINQYLSNPNSKSHSDVQKNFIHNLNDNNKQIRSISDLNQKNQKNFSEIETKNLIGLENNRTTIINNNKLDTTININNINNINNFNNISNFPIQHQPQQINLFPHPNKNSLNYYNLKCQEMKSNYEKIFNFFKNSNKKVKDGEYILNCEKENELLHKYILQSSEVFEEMSLKMKDFSSDLEKMLKILSTIISKSDKMKDYLNQTFPLIYSSIQEIKFILSNGNEQLENDILPTLEKMIKISELNHSIRNLNTEINFSRDKITEIDCVEESIKNLLNFSNFSTNIPNVSKHIYENVMNSMIQRKIQELKLQNANNINELKNESHVNKKIELENVLNHGMNMNVNLNLHMKHGFNQNLPNLNSSLFNHSQNYNDFTNNTSNTGLIINKQQVQKEQLNFNFYENTSDRNRNQIYHHGPQFQQMQQRIDHNFINNNPNNEKNNSYMMNEIKKMERQTVIKYNDDFSNLNKNPYLNPITHQNLNMNMNLNMNYKNLNFQKYPSIENKNLISGINMNYMNGINNINNFQHDINK